MHRIKERTMISYSTCDCPTCGGSGVVPVVGATENYGYDADYGYDGTAVFSEPCPDCNGGFDRKVKEVKEVSNVPPKYQGFNMSNFDWHIYRDAQGNEINLSRIKTVVEKFISEFAKWEKLGMGLYIWSNTKGSGKTFLASCICNELMKNRAMSTKFVSCANLVNLDKSADDKAIDKYERDPIALLCNCKLLFLDDVGAYTDNWTSKILFRILDHRKNNELPTIFTSNMKVGQLPLDDRIPERINDITMSIQLPEYCVRSKEANRKKEELIKELNL